MTPPIGRTLTNHKLDAIAASTMARVVAPPAILAALFSIGLTSRAWAREPATSGAAATSAVRAPATSGAAATGASATPSAPASSNKGAPAVRPVASIAPRTPTEHQAAQLAREALGWDFKQGHFLVGEGKLREAIRICGPEVCSVGFQSRLHRDLGYLYVAGLLRAEDGRDEFTLAWSLDPSLALTPGMQAPEVVRTFEEAKSPSAGAKSAPAAKPAEAEPAPVVPAPEPAREQPAAVPSPSDSDGSDATPVVDNSATWQLVHNWFSLSIQQDLVFHSKTMSACSAGSRYRCFDAVGQPTELAEGDYTAGGNQISGSGALPGTLRILLGFDRVVHPHVSLGIRVGSVISGKGRMIKEDPTFLYFHGEARLSLWIGRNVFSRAGLRPYLFLSAGFAEADGKILVDYTVPNDQNTYKLDAWKRSGHSFVGPGLGFQAAFTKFSGPIAELRYMQFLSPDMPVLAFQLGYSLGF